MTVNTTTSRVSYAGNGSTTTFSVPFYFLAAADLVVIRTASNGVQTTLVLNTDYTVTGAGNPAGGSVVCTTAPALATSLVIFRDPAATQLTDYQANDPFPAETHERALDKLTMLAQRLKDLVGRSFTLSDGDVSGASTQLPSPQANKIIGWNTSANGLQNVDPESLLTIAGSSGFVVQKFSGDGVLTAFTLSQNPGVIANLEVFIGGVRQTPDVNYTVSSTTLSFFVAPPAGTNNILVRWGQTLGIGIPSDTSVSTAKIADGAVTTAKLASTIAPTVLSLNDGQLAGMRNKIINGKMDVAQRGTSFAAVVSGSYTLDRWQFSFLGTSVQTVSQQADVPSSNEFQNSLRVAITTADTSIGSTDFAFLRQQIEGYNARDLIGKTFTLSFWVRSSKTGVHCVALQNSGQDRSYILEYTVSAANTWEQKSLSVSGGLITAGTWNWTNGTGLAVAFSLAQGSSQQTTAGAWQTGNFLATANQVNCLDSNTNIFAITGVQLEPGAVATPFEHRSYGAELALCQRYYHAGSHGTLVGCYSTNTWMLPRISFPAEMRATPTIVYAAATSGLTGATPTANSPDTKGTRATVSTTGTANTLNFIDVTYTAAAEL